jgi:transposase
LNPLFVGIDISIKDLKLRSVNDAGQETGKRLHAPNDRTGIDLIEQHLLRVMRDHNLDKLYVGFEATSTYHWPLQMALAESNSLATFKPEICPFNARIIAQFKKSMGNLPKDDWTDSFVIAERLRFKRPPHGPTVDFRFLPLQRLTRFRYHLVSLLVREKNYFLTNLFLKFNTLCTMEVFADRFGATATAIATEFLSPDEIAARPLAELIQFLMERGHQHFDNPEATAKNLVEAARKAHRLRAELQKPVTLVLKTSLESIRALERSIQQIDKAIAQMITSFPNTLLSVKGLGPVITAGIIAEVGYCDHLSNESKLAKLAGLTWPSHDSGDFQSEDNPMSQHGNVYLRYYLIEGANSVRFHTPEFANFYNRKYQETPKHKHRRALVLTARKLVRLVYALLRTNQLYSPSRRKVV